MLASNLLHRDLVKAITHVGIMINLQEHVQHLTMEAAKGIKIIS